MPIDFTGILSGSVYFPLCSLIDKQLASVRKRQIICRYSPRWCLVSLSIIDCLAKYTLLCGFDFQGLEPLTHCFQVWPCAPWLSLSQMLLTPPGEMRMPCFLMATSSDSSLLARSWPKAGWSMASWVTACAMWASTRFFRMGFHLLRGWASDAADLLQGNSTAFFVEFFESIKAVPAIAQWLSHETASLQALETTCPARRDCLIRSQFEHSRLVFDDLFLGCHRLNRL